jgi:hypothetical protein
MKTPYDFQILQDSTVSRNKKLFSLRLPELEALCYCSLNLELTCMIETVKLNVIIILLVILKATQVCSVVTRSDFAAML